MSEARCAAIQASAWTLGTPGVVLVLAERQGHLFAKLGAAAAFQARGLGEAAPPLQNPDHLSRRFIEDMAVSTGIGQGVPLEQQILAFGDAVLIAGEAPADPGQAAQFQPVAARVRKFGLDLPR